jgi:hypothetical protein
MLAEQTVFHLMLQSANTTWNSTTAAPSIMSYQTLFASKHNPIFFQTAETSALQVSDV